jgi:hypothetical protein
MDYNALCLLGLFDFVKNNPSSLRFSREHDRIRMYAEDLIKSVSHLLVNQFMIQITLSPLTDRYVPSATHRAPFLQYPLTRHFLSRFASPSQLSRGKLKRTMYFLSCERMETARDMARKERACPLHHEEERPYLTNALYASDKIDSKGNDIL